jgi:hypothetical protein
MKKFIYLALILSLASCKSYQLSTYYTEPVTINGVEADVIENEFQLDRKFRLDDKFRWNFAQYAMNQDLRWYSDFYFNNRMYRSRFGSPFDLYWNANQYWWNWSVNYNFNTFNHWNRFGFYNNFYGYSNTFGYNRYWNQWEHRDRSNIAYINSRRGSNMSIQDRRGNAAMIETAKRSNSKGRRGINTIPADVDIKIRRITNNKNENVLTRIIDKFEDKGIRIRTYNNPNQINNDKIIRPNPRSYNRTESGNNGGRSWNRQDVPSQPTRSRQPNAVQPRQVRGGSGSPVLQQSRSSQQSSSQGRSSSSRVKN